MRQELKPDGVEQLSVRQFVLMKQLARWWRADKAGTMRLMTRQWNSFDSWPELNSIKYSSINLYMNVIEHRESKHTPCVIGASFVEFLYVEQCGD